MKLNIDKCNISTSVGERKNKNGNWEVTVCCDLSRDSDRSCYMVYQFGCYSKKDAENWALRKFIVDRFTV